MKRWLGFLVLGLALLCGNAAADGITGLRLDDQPSYLVRPHAFTLHNNTGRDFVFFMAAKGTDWSRQDLPRDQIKEYSDGRSDSYIIELPTAGYGAVRYALQSGRRYQIYWNGQAYRWDLIELGARQ